MVTRVSQNKENDSLVIRCSVRIHTARGKTMRRRVRYYNDFERISNLPPKTQSLGSYSCWKCNRCACTRRSIHSVTLQSEWHLNKSTLRYWQKLKSTQRDLQSSSRASIKMLMLPSIWRLLRPITFGRLVQACLCCCGLEHETKSSRARNTSKAVGGYLEPISSILEVVAGTGFIRIVISPFSLNSSWPQYPLHTSITAHIFLQHYS